MKENSELFHLIKSLNKNEKRYFKLYSSLQKGNKKYLTLFTEIEKMKVYDEIKIRNALTDEDLRRHLAFNKNYLRSLILKSLVLYNSSNIVDIKIQNKISYAKILFRKALFGQYFRMLRAAKQMAFKHERFGYLLEIIDMEKIILKKEELHVKKSSELYKQTADIIAALNNKFEYSRVISLTLHNYRDTGIKRDKKHDQNIKQLLNNPILKLENKPQSISAKESFYRIRQLAAEAEGNFELVLFNLKKRLSIAEKYRLVFKDNIIDLQIDILTELINNSIKLNKLNEAKKYLKKMGSLRLINETDKIDVGVTTVFATFQILIKKKNYIIAYNYIPETELLLERYKNKLLIETELSIKFNIVKTLILAGKYEKALSAMNSLLAHSLINKREDYRFYLVVLNLIIHYELKNFSLLNHLIRSTHRMLLKQKRLYKTEQAILKFLKKLPGIENDAEHLKHLNNFKKTLTILKNEPYEKNAFEYFDFLEWVESKINS